MRDGIILVYKPTGVSSAQVLTSLKRKNRSFRKIGHCGTLDPFASGLLVCLVNRATRLANYVQAGKKCYSGVIELGMTTDTDDITGNVLTTSEALPTLEAISEVCQAFVGRIEQVPPVISAVKVDGKRAYRLAREGKDFQLSARSVTLYRFDLLGMRGARVSFSLDCSSGFYVRSLARDIGERLGCGGCLSELRRESSYPFSAHQAEAPSAVNEGSIRPWSEIFPHIPRLVIPQAAVSRIANGDFHQLRNLSAELDALAAPEGSPAIVLYGSGVHEISGALSKREGVWKVAFNIPENTTPASPGSEHHEVSTEESPK